MPESSYHGTLPALTSAEREVAASLKRDVVHLASTIGERNHLRYAELVQAMEFVEGRFSEIGLTPEREGFEAGGQVFANIVVEIQGQRATLPRLVVGAHYDSAQGTPAANDNGSGVAALLAIGRSLKLSPLERSVRLVAFVNEEPPHFRTPAMGSLVHAERCRQRGEALLGMLSLETIGYYSDEEGSQHYPPGLGWLYPSTGNFVAFVGNVRSRELLRRVVGSFRRQVRFPSEGAALPAATPGAGWSDHWAFWQYDYPGIMVTDTAPFRYPHYHRATDTPDKIDHEKTARVTLGLVRVIESLCGR
jgi:hypothetical protein